jgi:hypothetical protein
MREPRFYENPSCAEIGGDLFFPEKEGQPFGNIEIAMAKRICQSCPHKTECAEWGIKREIYGIWGGLLPRQRQIMRKELNITLREEDVA